MTTLSDTSSPAFEPLLTEIQQRLATGEELDMSLFVDVDGEPVVDVWGGLRRLTIAYVMNRMGADTLGSERSAAYVGAIYDAL